MGRRRGFGGKGRSLSAWGCWRLTERAGAAGGRGWRPPRAGPGGQAWREGARADTGGLTGRETHTRRLTVAGARGAGGPRRALTWQQRRRRRRHPRPGRSPRAPGLPPGGRAGGRRRPRGGGGDAGASDCWAAGTQLHQPTLGRSARLGRARSCSAPFGPARLGWGRGPRPPAQVASCARGAGL